ncbi:hypothetical protein HMH01_09375 [Halovulum dunhuangense]|uniref:Uncharacterized protein n=1 Tax=Halovulum dunhuangense TaxID=1505036 RepID=A0A849L2X7_9RHOB|nr:hypothetical protein [Halovulum dunhuangense]NNU80645.1 hypothetical protein [Halovulum dunhuangense]
MKSLILINNKPVKEYNHGLKALYTKLCQIIELNFYFNRPDSFQEKYYLEESPLKFLDRIERFTSPSSRYNAFGNLTKAEDIIKIDQFVLRLEQLIQSTNSEKSSKNTSISDKISKIYEDMAKLDFSTTSINGNIIFQGIDNISDTSFAFFISGSSSPTSILEKQIRNKKLHMEDIHDVIKIIEWLHKNIKLPKEQEKIFLEFKETPGKYL